MHGIQCEVPNLNMQALSFLNMEPSAQKHYNMKVIIDLQL